MRFTKDNKGSVTQQHFSQLMLTYEKIFSKLAFTEIEQKQIRESLCLNIFKAYAKLT